MKQHKFHTVSVAILVLSALIPSSQQQSTPEIKCGTCQTPSPPPPSPPPPEVYYSPPPPPPKVTPCPPPPSPSYDRPSPPPPPPAAPGICGPCGVNAVPVGTLYPIDPTYQPGAGPRRSMVNWVPVVSMGLVGGLWLL